MVTKAQDNVLLLIRDSGVLTAFAVRLYRVRQDVLYRLNDAGLIVWRHRSQGRRLTPAGRAYCRDL